VSNFSTLWHRKCFCGFGDFNVLAFFLSGCIKPVSSCSDDEEPQRDAAAAPSTQAIIPNEPSAQEVEPAVQAPRTTRASVKKVPMTRSTKRSKKSKEADVSLEAHVPTSSSDDVSGCIALIFLAPSVYLYVLPSSGTDEEVCRLGY
jgi:hypothetical protein